MSYIERRTSRAPFIVQVSDGRMWKFESWQVNYGQYETRSVPSRIVVRRNFSGRTYTASICTGGVWVCVGQLYRSERGACAAAINSLETPHV